MLNIGRKSQNNPYFRQEYQLAKNRYFNAIKRAKTNYWNQFLEKEDLQLIFKAMAYTKDIMVLIVLYRFIQTRRLCLGK